MAPGLPSAAACACSFSSLSATLPAPRLNRLSGLHRPALDHLAGLGGGDIGGLVGGGLGMNLGLVLLGLGAGGRAERHCGDGRHQGFGWDRHDETPVKVESSTEKRTTTAQVAVRPEQAEP